MIRSVPQQFEGLIEAAPLAPAVILVRPDRPDRVWVRAAVEHRAARVAAVCASLGLSSGAQVALELKGALDRLAAAYYVLATGRVLVPPGPNAFILDARVISQSEVRAAPYALRSGARSADLATTIPRPLAHADLFALLLERGGPEDDPVWQALLGLATGKPLVVQADDDAAPWALVYAA